MSQYPTMDRKHGPQSRLQRFLTHVPLLRFHFSIFNNNTCAPSIDDCSIIFSYQLTDYTRVFPFSQIYFQSRATRLYAPLCRSVGLVSFFRRFWAFFALLLLLLVVLSFGLQVFQSFSLQDRTQLVTRWPCYLNTRYRVIDRVLWNPQRDWRTAYKEEK